MTSSWKDAVVQSPSGVLLRLHVVPGSSKTVFPAGYNEWRRCIEMRVAGDAKENKANTDVKATLATFFHLSSKDLRIVSGEKSREKTILLANIKLDVVIKQLEEQINGPNTGARGT